MIAQKVRQLFGSNRKKSSTSDFYQSLYPESVRYALAHNAAQLGKSEIRALVDRFPHEAVYLVTKGLAYAPGQQRDYLEGLTQIYARIAYHPDDLRHFLDTQIKALPDDMTVSGTKLLQLSRAGSDHWQTAFHELAERCHRDDHHALPCIVAYTPMLGYHHFVQAFSRDSLNKLQLLVPEWMLNPDEERMGYEITLGTDVNVRSQVKHECLYGSWVCLHTECPMKHRFCEDAIFIDDTINTGTTSNKLRSFWHSAYGLNVPNERIRVITDLRTSTKTKPLINGAVIAIKDIDHASHEGNSTV
jgi:hypothetical protein